MRIAIVGGGTAGLIAALILRTKFNSSFTIDVIASKQIGTIGVGEGSTEHWREFMHFVGIDPYELIAKTDSALKAGVIFEGWGDETFYHCVQDPYSVKFGQYRALYGKLIGESASSESFIADHTIHNQIDSFFLNDPSKFPTNQYNFNTFKLIEFLTDVSKQKGINFIDDIIKDITFDQAGNIDTLISDTATYDYDFYIDCTGLRRVLMSKLGAKWQSHSKYLKMKSAMVFPTPEEEEIPLWILAKAMDAGWMFRTPIWGRWGNGYIYDSDYITVDQAKDEIDQYFGRDITIGQHINFDPGALDRFWIKNCVAVGLSGSFIEPLEASSIGSTIHQMFLLMHRLVNYDQTVIDDYNKSCASMIENIRDFVVLHYVTKRSDTQFWQDVNNIELPDSLQANLEKWRTKLPIQEDFSSHSDYIMYNEINHIMLLNGLDLFDKQAIYNEYDTCHEDLKNEVNRILSNRLQEEQTAQHVPHRLYLELIRNHYGV